MEMMPELLLQHLESKRIIVKQREYDKIIMNKLNIIFLEQREYEKGCYKACSEIYDDIFGYIKRQIEKGYTLKASIDMFPRF